MAHIGKLPGFQRLITTHNTEGKAIISNAVDAKAPYDGTVEGGTAAFSLAYTTTEFPVDLTGDKDVRTYKEYLQKPPGLVQNTGSVLRIVDIGPAGRAGPASPMHRTVSLDYGIVLVGDIELILDGGETRTMKAGDICIQRGTMHAWRNNSETEWARMLFVLQPSLPVEIGEQKLGEDLGPMKGVRSSS